MKIKIIIRYSYKSFNDDKYEQKGCVYSVRMLFANCYCCVTRVYFIFKSIMTNSCVLAHIYTFNTAITKI